MRSVQIREAVVVVAVPFSGRTIPKYAFLKRSTLREPGRDVLPATLTRTRPLPELSTLVFRFSSCLPTLLNVVTGFGLLST